MKVENVVIDVDANKVVVAKNVSARVREFIAANFGFGCDWVDIGDSFVLFGLRSSKGLIRCLNSDFLFVL